VIKSDKAGNFAPKIGLDTFKQIALHSHTFFMVFQASEAPATLTGAVAMHPMGFHLANCATDLIFDRRVATFSFSS